MKDIQGVQRGKCNTCECEEYRTSPKPQPGQLRCEYCNHTPGEHVRIITLGACSSCGKEECGEYQSEDPHRYTDCGYCGCPAQLHAGADKLRRPRPQSQQPGASMMFHMMSLMFDQMKVQGAAGGGEMRPGFQPRYDAHDQPLQQVTYGTCKCPGCSFPRRREGDKIHDFCSRTCAKKFDEYQSSLHQQKVAATKISAQPLGGSGQASYSATVGKAQPGYKQPATSGEPGHRSSEGGSGQRSYSAALPGSQATSQSSGSGGHTAFKVYFQKSPSKYIGLIVSEEMYRCDTFSGVLVLGFEYNTKAEHLIKSGEVRVLDVITSLNDKPVSPLTYKQEAQSRSCCLVLNRSIALPQLTSLMEKAKLFNPTSLVVVLNPNYIPNCSIAKGFGLGVTTHLGTTTVRSVTENTPARFSRLKIGDEIIAYGFVKNNKLEIEKGALTSTDMDLAAIAGKTLVLVLKRPAKN